MLNKLGLHLEYESLKTIRARKRLVDKAGRELQHVDVREQLQPRPSVEADQELLPKSGADRRR